MNSAQTFDQLKEEIVTHSLITETNVKNINVLLVGEVSAGKSSLFNSVESVFGGHVTQRANSGSIDKSLTTQVC